MAHSPKKSIKRVVFFVIVLACILVSIPAVDYTTSIHVGFEPDQSNVYTLTSGLDLRVLGGRGVFGAKLSVDYLPKNTRNYHSTPTSGNMFIISGYGLIQASIYYGDLTFYAGPGTSLYIMPGIAAPNTFASLAEDSVLHLTLGTAYNLYPLQVFAEVEIDLDISMWILGITRPRIRVGAGFLQ